MAEKPNPQNIADPLSDLKTSAEQARIKLTPEIERLLLEGAEKVEAKVLAHERLTKADLAFVGESKKMIEFERFRQIELPEQYGKRLETLSFYGFLDEKGATNKGDVPVPTLERAMAIFTPEMLRLASTFQEPTLLLVPETSFAAKVKAIDAKKTMEGQKETYVDDLHKGSDSGTERITGWKVAIVDGANDMDPERMGDDVALKLRKRIENRKEARGPAEAGMDRHLYAMLMLEGIMKGEPTDRIANGYRYTLLEDDPANSASRVPHAYWDPDDRRVFFLWSHPGGVNDDGRFRRSVGGDVKP
jgi:hypothetical protein